MPKEDFRKIAAELGLSPEEYKRAISQAEKFGVIAPRKDGVIEETWEGVQHGVLTGVKGFGSTLEELDLGDGLNNYMTDVMERNQDLLPDPTYKATSFDPAHLGRTIGTGTGQSGTALTAGVVTTALSGGNPVAGGAVITGITFAQTYGDEVKEFRKAMPNQSEDTIQGLAFISALGQGLIESVAGPEAIASGLAKKIVEGAVKDTVKQYGKKRVLQVLKTVTTNAVKGGLGEGAEEVFQGIVSNMAKRSGGVDIPLMTMNEAIEQFAGGALPGMFMSGVTGMVETSNQGEAETEKDTGLLDTTPGEVNTDIQELPDANRQVENKKRYDDSQVKSFKKHWNKTKDLPSEDLTENLQRLTKDSSLNEKAVLILKPKSKLTKSLAEVSKELTGQEPVYFLPKTPEAGLANGFIGKNNQLFINVETMANNPGVTTGHEFGHFLSRTDNATYKSFQKILADNLKDNHNEYLESILSTYDKKGIDLTQEQGLDELTNDVIGDFFVDDKFWREVFSSKQDTGKLQKLARAIIRFVDTIAGKLKGVNGTNEYLSDLEKVRSEAAKIVSEKLGVENTDTHGQTQTGAEIKEQVEQSETSAGEVVQKDENAVQEAVEQPAGRNAELFQEKSDISDISDKNTEADYSLKRDIAGFEKQVDDVSLGKLPKSGMIDVLARTPKAIQEAGALDLPIEIRANKIKQIVDKHSLPLDIIKHIPEQLDKPLMIFEADRRKDSLVILTKLEHNGGSVMAALQLNKNRAHYEINRINSIYAKHKDVFVRYIKAGLLRYADKNKAPEWLHSVGLAEEILQGSRDKSYQRLSEDNNTPQDDKSQADYSLNMVRAKQNNPGVSPEVRELNEAVQDSYDPGVRTHEDLDKKADATIKQYGEEHLLKNLASGHLVMNTDENMRLGLKLINSDKMIDMIRKGDIAATDAMTQWVKQGTEAGRLLNSRKIKTNSPEDIFGILKGLLFAPSKKYRHETDPAKKRELLKTHERKLINKALNNLKSKDIDFFNLTQEQLADIKLISTIAREIQIAKSNFGDKAYEWWINGLLSLPKTHAANIIGNTAMAVTELAPQRFIEASLNLIVKNKKGASFGEFKHMWKALRKHAKSGLRDAGIAFKTGTPIRDTVQKLESTNAAIPGKFGEAVRLPGRFLLAADEFAKSIIIPVEATAYAYRIAKAEGLKGEALNERIKELTENGKSEAVEWATVRAEELTFQAKPWAFVEYLVAAKNEAGISGRILGYIFPFIRTPSNILTTTFRKSPFGSAALFARLATGKIKISDEKFIRHSAEQLIAWGTVMSIWSLMGDDDEDLPFITGSKGRYGTSEYKWKQRNLPNTSIRIGERWYDYSRIEPFGSALAMMVDGLNSISLINKGAEGEKVINNLMKSVMATNIRDKSFLQSVGDVIKAFEDPKSMSKLGTNFISSWVPNVVRGTLNALDDSVPDGYNYAKGIQFYKEQFLDGVGKRAGMGATPRIDLWGNEIHKDDIKGDVNPFLWRIASPMRTRQTGMHKPDQLLFNWNSHNVNDQYWPIVPSPKYSRLHKSLYMNSDLYHKYAKRAGELAFGKVEQLISAGRLNYRKPSASDIKLLKKVFRKSRQQAKRELLK